jgi:hypothetical protein
MAKWIMACKEVAGGVFMNRLPQAIDDHTPGVPDVWHFVGPGSNPSVQEYSGDRFVLTFDYLSHLYCRVVDTSVWPPTQVNPVQISGGPNPPTPFTYNIQLPQESLTIKTEGSSVVSLTAPFFNPPIIQQPLLFLDVLTNTYSVTIQPVGGYAPQVPANVTPFYRLYRRAIGSTPWILVDDWQTSSTFVDSNVGSLRYQYSMTWGSQFLPSAPFDPTQHAEGIPGQRFITVDSDVQAASFQFTLNESLTLDLSSLVVAPDFAIRQQFLNEAPPDTIELSKSSIGNGENTFAFFDVRQAFVNDAEADQLAVWSQSNAYQGGNVLQAVMG